MKLPPAATLLIYIQEATDLNPSLYKWHYACGILRFLSVRAGKFRGNTAATTVIFKHFAIPYATILKNELISK
jgi:hypothetical protein